MIFTIRMYRKTSNSLQKVYRSRKYLTMDSEPLNIFTDISDDDMRRIVMAYLTKEVESGNPDWINSSLAQHDLHVRKDFLETTEGRRIVIEDLAKALNTLSNEELDRNVWLFENEIILIEGHSDHGSAYRTTQ